MLHVIPALFCSFCNRAGSLKEDDLEECEAVVLHQLRALLQSALNGCLLPEKTLDAKGRAVDEKQTRYHTHKTCMWVWLTFFSFPPKSALPLWYRESRSGARPSITLENKDIWVLIFTHLGSSCVTQNENIKQIHLFCFSFTDGESYSVGQRSGRVLLSRQVCSISHPRLLWQGGKCINFRDLLASNFCDLQCKSQARRMGNVILRSKLFFCEAEDSHSL